MYVQVRTIVKLCDVRLDQWSGSVKGTYKYVIVKLCDVRLEYQWSGSVKGYSIPDY